MKQGNISSGAQHSVQTIDGNRSRPDLVGPSPMKTPLMQGTSGTTCRGSRRSLAYVLDMTTHIACVVVITIIILNITMTIAISIASPTAFPVQCNTWWNVAHPAMY